MALAIPENIREYLRIMGAQGDRARAQKYSKEKLAEWGELGGGATLQRNRTAQGASPICCPVESPKAMQSTNGRHVR
jgi:hypothetical protein